MASEICDVIEKCGECVVEASLLRMSSLCQGWSTLYEACEASADLLLLASSVLLDGPDGQPGISAGVCDVPKEVNEPTIASTRALSWTYEAELSPGRCRGVVLVFEWPPCPVLR